MVFLYYWTNSDDMKTVIPHYMSRFFLLFLMAVMSSPSVFGSGYESGLPGNVETEVQARSGKVKKGRLKALVSSMRTKQQRRAVIKGLWQAIKDEGGSNIGTWALILVLAGVVLLVLTFLLSVSALFWPGVLATLVGIIMGFTARGSDKKAGSVAAGIGITILIVLLGLFVLLLAAIYLILEGLGF